VESYRTQVEGRNTKVQEQNFLSWGVRPANESSETTCVHLRRPSRLSVLSPSRRSRSPMPRRPGFEISSQERTRIWSTMPPRTRPSSRRHWATRTQSTGIASCKDLRARRRSVLPPLQLPPPLPQLLRPRELASTQEAPSRIKCAAEAWEIFPIHAFSVLAVAAPFRARWCRCAHVLLGGALMG